MGQILIEYTCTFVLDHSVLLSGIVFLILIVLDFYARNVKVNLDTDNVDLMQRYMWLQMRRRYGNENL